MRQVNRTVIAGSAAFALAYLVARDHLHHNTSGSLPVVWDWASVTYTVSRGDLVELCPPEAVAGMASERDYVDHGPCPGGTVPFLKLVAAVGGDRVHIDARGTSVNGQRVLPNSIGHRTDKHGRRLPVQPYGTQMVPHGDVWLYGTDEWSLDSRYFGAVPADTIRYRAQPLIAARLPDLR
jgi:conjugative transfer signal peptidase TraF